MKEIIRLIKSFGYAFRGIGYGIRSQRNLRIHLTATAVVVIFGLMARVSLTHWCILTLCCGLVISLELVNTALEAACDKISTKEHTLIRHAKDAAAGAVLVSALGSLVIAGLMLMQGEYLQNIRNYFTLPEYQWVRWGVAGLALAAVLFIFLPCWIPTRKKK